MLKKQTEDLNNKYVENNQTKSDLEKKHSDLAIEEEHLAKKLDLYEGFYAPPPMGLVATTSDEPKTPVEYRISIFRGYSQGLARVLWSCRASKWFRKADRSLQRENS